MVGASVFEQANSSGISTHDSHYLLGQVVATACLVWYAIVVTVAAIGYVQLFRHFSRPPRPAAIQDRPASALPHITIIRPVKGVEPHLYECLAATFRQTYPSSRLTVCLCVASKHDPAYPILKRVVADHPHFDARILVEEEDPVLRRDVEAPRLGPNPKIRNMSRAYREARGDIIWILDCNVWVGKGVAGRMVQTLGVCEGLPRYKFVHQLPLVVDVLGNIRHNSTRSESPPGPEGQIARGPFAGPVKNTAAKVNPPSKLAGILRLGGGRLEEAFMSSAHAKFYTAINTVLIAPCIVGKSTMFRRSHLDHLTGQDGSHTRGIDYFSENICEDHLIGDILWRGRVPDETDGQRWGKHALVFGDLVIQPMADMSVADYIARRVRWLRVRKFTVRLATLVEPGTECLLCSLYGAFAVTTQSWIHDATALPQTWAFFWFFWASHVTLWAATDWILYRRLQSASSVEVDERTPSFARPPREGNRRTFPQWLLAWLGREVLAFPIWAWAVLGGTSVTWRGKRLWVGLDMKVHEYSNYGRSGNGNAYGSSPGLSKARQD